jgi:hypothetical protein
MSKGSKQRPTNHDAFSGNFDKIFTEKPIRGSFIQDPETGELVPKDQYYAPSNASHYVMPDIQPYQSMQTGEMITSRSHHRAHLKQHGLIEIGNEIKTAMTKQQPRDDRESRKRTIAEVLSSKGY